LEELCSNPRHLRALLERHGSPVHLHRPALLAYRAREFQDAAAAADVDLELFFARKANKAIAWLDAARDAGIGVDVASEIELDEALGRGIPGSRIVITAVLKGPRILARAIESGACVVVDRLDEVSAFAAAADAAETPLTAALRLRGFPFEPEGGSRFGIHLDDVDEAVRKLLSPETAGRLRVKGLHFHLDGYDPEERVVALEEALHLADRLRSLGFPIAFIDMGGGIPVTYVPDRDRWREFLERLEAGALGESPSITWPGDDLGMAAAEGMVARPPVVYPQHETPVGGEWLGTILDSSLSRSRHTVARALGRRGLTLRLEPGRALLSGGGATAARVAFVKPAAGGRVFVGLAMSATHCRSRKSEPIVDPWLVPGRRRAHSTASVEGWLVGTCCAEGDRIITRRLAFPRGVAQGDVVVIPDTAGYLMHFVEGRIHRDPLPRNVVLREQGMADHLDEVDETPQEGEVMSLR
jgi:diaminopimelate decarboxylase